MKRQLFVVLGLALIITMPAHACKWRKHRNRQCAAPAYGGYSYQATTVQSYVGQPAPLPTPQVAVPAGDPAGFTAWLNSTRAAYGLPAVGYDSNLEHWAAINSSQQTVSGLGHFVMGPARRQNSGMGSLYTVQSMWMASPGHRDALLDPTIRYVAISQSGAYWTFNGY